jgi:hypothetical protein
MGNGLTQHLQMPAALAAIHPILNSDSIFPSLFAFSISGLLFKKLSFCQKVRLAK